MDNMYMSVGADGRAAVHTDTFCGRLVVDAESYKQTIMDIHFNADMSEEEKDIQRTLANAVAKKVVPENEMTLLLDRAVTCREIVEKEQERRRDVAEAVKAKMDLRRMADSLVDRVIAREKQERSRGGDF